ncbi:MAG: DUF1772 domain-containing protein [Verrucomicrobia bacterium]|nr:DUF1772 domain-containing protein [Verrucomicrobiota bacterium]
MPSWAVLLHLFFLALILSTALLLGNEFSVSAFLHPALKRRDHRGFLPVIQIFASLFGAVMPVWMGATLCAHIILLVATWAWSLQSSFLLLAACLLWLGIIVFSVVGPVPINNRVKTWGPDALPADWEAQRRRWDRLNAYRVVLIAVAFACLLLAYKDSPVGRPERPGRMPAANASGESPKA